MKISQKAGSDSPILVNECTVVDALIPAGFPSPAEQYNTSSLSIAEFVTHPSATYLMKAQGYSMVGVGIFDRDILVVNRALEPREGDVVIACIEGEFACKVYSVNRRALESAPDPTANESYPSFHMDHGVVIEGVVQFSLRAHRGLGLG